VENRKRRKGRERRAGERREGERRGEFVLCPRKKKEVGDNDRNCEKST